MIIGRREGSAGSEGKAGKVKQTWEGCMNGRKRKEDGERLRGKMGKCDE